jgi:nucleoid-associated protein YgaU
MRLIILLLLAGLLPVVAESSEYMLFTPSPLEGELLIPERGKGVLVRRITIKPGDTLSRISRSFSGRGSYFPQILLFNDIQNPDRIFAGKELLVPVSKKDAAAKTSDTKKRISAPVKKETTAKSKPAAVKPAVSELPKVKASRKSPGKVAQKNQLPSGKPIINEEQDSYAAAISSYRKEDYKKALLLFSRFLELYPSSPLAPDASFLKAECLFKLSGQ